MVLEEEKANSQRLQEQVNQLNTKTRNLRQEKEDVETEVESMIVLQGPLAALTSGGSRGECLQPTDPDYQAQGCLQEGQDELIIVLLPNLK